jgi:hypothetical protein
MQLFSYDKNNKVFLLIKNGVVHARATLAEILKLLWG